MPIRLAALVAALAFGAFAQAAPPDPLPIVPALGTGATTPAPMTKEQAKALQVRIEEQYDHAQARCKRVEGRARELCNEQARGDRDIQAAELDLRMQPSADNDEKLRLARAQAAHSLALVKCKSLDGPARGVCRADAKSVLASARADAKLQKQVVAQALRSDETVRERTLAAERAAEAQFKAARERCELLPGEGRANCLADAKKRFAAP